MALVGEAFDMHIPKGYIYVAMAFRWLSSHQHPGSSQPAKTRDGMSALVRIMQGLNSTSKHSGRDAG